jgi:hypothetical protein
MSNIVKKLSTAEWAELKDLIRQVNDRKTAMFEMAELLTTIKDKQLYREHGTFAEFCEKTFKFRQAYLYRLVQGLEAKKSLPPALSSMVENPRVAAAVAAVPEAKREEVVQAAVEATDGHVTAAAVTKAAAQIQEAEVIVTDANGRTVPEGIVALWKEADRITEELLPLARKLKHEIKAGVEDKEKNLVWMDATNGDTSPIQATINLLTLTVAPHAVCYVCNGVRPQKCKLCKGRGFIGKHLWTTCPEETKKMLAKGK